MENPRLVAEAEPANPQISRIVWIDLARAGAILSVVTYHVGILPLGWFFTAFQLPLFAFLTGYATRWESMTLAKLAKKWLLWGSIYSASGIFSLAVWYLITPLYKPLPTLLRFTFESQWTGLISGAGLPANGPLWFFLPFAIATTLTAAVVTLGKKNALLLSAIAFTLIDMPSKIFFLSLLLGSHWKKQKIQPQLKTWQFLLAALLFFLSAWNNQSTDLHYGDLGNPILFLVSSLTGTLLTLHLAHWKKIPELLSWIGQQSLPLFVLHWPAMLIVTSILFHLGILQYFDAQPGLVSAITVRPETFEEVLKTCLLWFLILANTLVLTLAMSEAYKKLYSLIMYRRESTH